MQCQLGAHTFTFATTRELKDRLLDSFADSAYAGGPFIVVGPDPVPAWRWLGELARLRSDWRPAAGIALQHAAAEGGGMAQRALADLVANDRGTTLLLPWTEPLVPRFGSARATQATTGFGGGQVEPTFSEVMRDQRVYWDTVTQPDREVVLDAGKPQVVTLTREGDLEALLTRTAQRGVWYPSAWSDGPWSWLHDEIVFRDWVPGVVPGLIEAMLQRGEPEVVSALDWLSDGWDPWRFRPLLDGFASAHPPWWGVAAKLKPPGWKRAMRPATWSGVKTLGDVALRLMTRAREAAANGPTLDLDALG